MLLKLECFLYSTSPDLNMGHYHIRISKNVINLCTIIHPWVKYFYKRLPMGVMNSPDTLQQKTNYLFHGFEFIRAYIYDILILTKGERTDHIHKLESTLNKLKGKGLKCNTERSFFGKTEMEYLVFWVTRDGVKLINRKIEAITNIAPPTSRK